ncbi:MAG: hypothetical protein ABI721_03065 [Candidatus Dojkabacteria bacterium]
MKNLSRKIKVLIVVILVLILCSVSGIVLFNKPSGEYNQHPMPELIGTLKFPEYLDGGCASYSYAEKTESSYAMIDPPYISRDIALKNIESDSVFWNKIKQILGISNKWVVGSYHNSKDGAVNKYRLFLCININDWNTFTYDAKFRMLSETIVALNQIEGSTGELYIYTSDNPGTKWTSYASIDKEGNKLVRFDWRRSIFEEFVDNINPYGDPDPT